jgi:hypothetical protein
MLYVMKISTIATDAIVMIAKSVKAKIIFLGIPLIDVIQVDSPVVGFLIVEQHHAG